MLVDLLWRDPVDGTCFVQSAYGRRSDWFANVLACPEVEVGIRHERFSARAAIVSREAASEILARYVSAHPLYSRIVSWWLGYRGRLQDQRSLVEWLTSTFATVSITPRFPSSADTGREGTERSGGRD